MRLADKVAIVTGSGQGIGMAIAKGMAAEGASVVVSGRTAEKIQNVVDDIRKSGGKARRRAAFFDLSDEDWDIVLATGVKGVFNCVQAVARHMMDRRCSPTAGARTTCCKGATACRT